MEDVLLQGMGRSLWSIAEQGKGFNDDSIEAPFFVSGYET